MSNEKIEELNPELNTKIDDTTHSNKFQIIKEKAIGYVYETPIFVKVVSVFCLFLYVLSLISSNFVTFFYNTPALTLFSFRIYTLVTAAFFNIHIVNIILGLIVWIPEAIRMEKINGSIRYSLYFFFNCCLIQVFYVVIMFVFSIFGSSILSIPSYGLWPFIISEITIVCLSTPENKISILDYEFNIFSKYYPFLLFLVFSLINHIQIDIILGIVYGHFFYNHLKEKQTYFDNFIQKIELSNFSQKYISNFRGFIPSIILNVNNFPKDNPASVENRDDIKQNINIDIFSDQLEIPYSKPDSEHSDKKSDSLNNISKQLTEDELLKAEKHEPLVEKLDELDYPNKQSKYYNLSEEV